jgi:predicted nucleotidyltransferase
MIDDQRKIQTYLEEISETQNVDILFAVESGSRAWGFASPDSDYDVRFIYRERIFDTASLFERKQTIEIMREEDGQPPIDLVGWSLKKSLHLGLASNAQIAEWIAEAPSYLEEDGFREDMKRLVNQSCPKALAHHYRGLAHQVMVMRRHLMGEEIPVAKKYLYAIRSSLAAQYILERPEQGNFPPILFGDLTRSIGNLDEKIYWEIQDLLEFKHETMERSGRRRFPVLDHWLIQQQKILLPQITALQEQPKAYDLAEDIYRKHLYKEIMRIQENMDLVDIPFENL